MNSIRQSGFTMIELMAAISIGALLLGIGLPSFSDFVRNSRLSSDFTTTLGDLVYARSEAVTRNAAISLCPSSNQSACNGTSNWSNGWIVFVDDGSGGGTANNRILDGNERLLRVRPAMIGAVALNFQNFASNNGILFDAKGQLENGNVSDIGQMIICNENGTSKAKGVSFSVIGSPRIMQDTNNNGIVDYINSSDTTTDINC